MDPRGSCMREICLKSLIQYFLFPFLKWPNFPLNSASLSINAHQSHSQKSISTFPNSTVSSNFHRDFNILSSFFDFYMVCGWSGLTTFRFHLHRSSETNTIMPLSSRLWLSYSFHSKCEDGTHQKFRKVISQPHPQAEWKQPTNQEIDYYFPNSVSLMLSMHCTLYKMLQFLRMT